MSENEKNEWGGQTSREENRFLKYNASGYYDGTAYKAIRKVLEEGKTMEEKKPQKGEILSIETQGGTRRDVLVIATFDNYATVLNLVEKSPEENDTIVRKTAPRYTDVARLGYVFYDLMKERIENISEGALESILCRVGIALGIPKGFSAGSQNVEPASSEIISDLKEQLADAEERYGNAQLKNARLEGERDTYRDLLFKTIPQAVEQSA